MNTKNNIPIDLNLIEQTRLLPKEKLGQLEKIKDDLLTKASQLETFRPEPLMRLSVLKDVKFPTPDSKYWQAVLERNVMFRNLMFSALDIQEKEADIEIKQAQIDELLEKGSPVNIALAKKLQVKKKRLHAEILFIKKEAEDRVREITVWTKIIKELAPQCKYPLNDPEAHLYETVLLRSAKQMEIIKQVGASDMNGAINIYGIAQTAAKQWKKIENRENKKTY